MKSRENFEYCYNGQLNVDSKNQIIVGKHLTQKANDKNELVRAIDEIEKNTDRLPEKASTDNGYRSSDNIGTLKDSKVEGYVATAREKRLAKRYR